jgi:hypothetical protein
VILMASLVPGRRGGMAWLWRVLVGPPLRARDVSREQITPVEGLPALSLDALTSVAYGPEAIIVVLAVAGAGALHRARPRDRYHYTGLALGFVPAVVLTPFQIFAGDTAARAIAHDQSDAVPPSLTQTPARAEWRALRDRILVRWPVSHNGGGNRQFSLVVRIGTHLPADSALAR